MREGGGGGERGEEEGREVRRRGRGEEEGRGGRRGGRRERKRYRILSHSARQTGHVQLPRRRATQ